MSRTRKTYCWAIAGFVVVLFGVLAYKIGHTASADNGTATHAAGRSNAGQIAKQFAQSATPGATISGASQAVCAPGPCSPGTFSAYTMTAVANGDGTTSARDYVVYRPHGLTPADTNRSPAILTFYAGNNCGFHTANRFSSLAQSGRFIVVYMEVPCGRDWGGKMNNWGKKNVNSSSATVPDDQPYVAAVVNAITQCPASGAAVNQCVDPQRIYAAGISSGGNMTADIMCDAQNSTLFRGYLVDSASLRLNHGLPNCPSTNRSFFVMMAVSNYSFDRLIYDNLASVPHLDVPAFADWAAGQLGCTGPRIDDAIGSPVQSTLRYTYAGPCAYVQPGSPAVVALGVQNGGHTWGCQDSDPGVGPNSCPGMPTPPGLGPGGLPKTNGLFVEAEFWNFVASGVSSATPAPPLVRPTAVAPPPKPAGGYVALGDAFASGDGNAPFAVGTDTSTDQCHRSLFAYPFEADALRGGRLILSLHPCSTATISNFYHGSARNHEPAQLRWLDANTRAVSLSVGWNDASLPAAVQSCLLDSVHCQAKWHGRVDRAIKTMASRSLHGQRSLYALYRTIASDAGQAKVIAVGYPRFFPAAVPHQCRTGVHGRVFSRSAMGWLNSEIQQLDGIISSAAAAGHISYVRASYRAFAGHEWCTHRPDLNGPGRVASAAVSRSSTRLGGKFTPDRSGQLALAQLVAKVL